MWPFLYFVDDRLSTAELTAARLDGDLVEIGDAFMPADAVETRELRAASFRLAAGSQRAVTHGSAAWIHGALAAPPAVHTLQRASDRRAAVPVDGRIRFRDVRIPAADLLSISGVAVTTPVRTLVDLVRDAVAGAGPRAHVDEMLAWRPALVADALRWMETSGPVHHKRAAYAELRSRQEDVTRYTS
ncbi:SAM-dependent methyltransferase [Microbacterium sp. EYE_5]|uniref:type IV toxin-antitoxin system AbiEi family antitoxin n=1 Tax=unclassified Microbacterium TaxID=2609290 RepID=UPI0020052232|nr:MULTISPECIES: type IV toxin-antitoxin system AbiEi family antitoxin [unclassified Microbacterium]MCK6080711.1 SAM-dependent methyltransferase [Microbacterium sp. EYE_382]MCK6085982.1 SAM-dependent methyltransferase [Microbacterium sp. EYE_384]MCK6124520.1 SAM-dependent methyltransferase [Microbacterium sp. EYE_80]MCK6127429.1 SAM-dependent methyltransferase [Microbacterium sp. EYE_79]MCK6141666.1 SAM-dependent methyltransferase [Microbacterium sp. EYE_39]